MQIFTWIFWGFVLLGLLAFTFSALRELPRQAGAEARSSAEGIAKHKWYVKGATVFGRKSAHWLDSKGWQQVKYGNSWVTKDAVVIKLSSVDLVGGQRQELALRIRPDHPSVEVLKRLSCFDIVGFDFVDKPPGHARGNELGAYLLLKA